MAEFCLECWNKINHTYETEHRYVMSRSKELCEECGQFKNVVVVERF